jgi:hypothetical protein
MAQLYGPGPGDPPPLVPSKDLAGLRTTDVEDRPVGELYGALSEQRTGLIRYLDVDLQGAHKHVLVPIGHVRIDAEGMQPRVRLRAALYEDLLAVPEYEPERTDVDATYHEQLLKAHGQLFYGAHYYAHPAFDHSALYAGAAPILVSPEIEDEGPSARGGPGVQPLSGLEGVRLAAADRDIRGRPVEDVHGDAVGEVVDLLVEPPRYGVRYGVIELSRPARRTAVPIGYLAPTADGERLVVRDLSVEDIRLLPPYDGPLTRADENRIRAALEGRLTGERYFQRPDFRSY